MPVLIAAIVYWAVVFAAGFILGTIRTILLVPYLGELIAVVIELPVMLAVSWLAACRIVRAFRLETPSQALAAGVLAFALLMAAEAMVGVMLLDEPLTDWAVSLFRLPGILGLAAQVAFAAMPWAALHRADASGASRP